MKIVLSKLRHVALAVALFVAAQTAVASNALFLSPADQLLTKINMIVRSLQ